MSPIRPTAGWGGLRVVDRRPVWRGTLTRDGDVLRGVVRDAQQWGVELVIRRTPEGYECLGYLGPTPPELRLPGEDEHRNPITEPPDAAQAQDASAKP